jgi:hypothetical protein
MTQETVTIAAMTICVAALLSAQSDIKTRPALAAIKAALAFAVVAATLSGRTIPPAIFAALSLACLAYAGLLLLDK